MVRGLYKVNCLAKIQYGHSIMLPPSRETIKSLEAVADYTVIYTESMSEGRCRLPKSHLKYCRNTFPHQETGNGMNELRMAQSA